MDSQKISYRIPELDGLRGIAALWVLLGHACLFTAFNVPLLTNPGVAVDIFMVMSGFLMTQHFFLREEREPWHEPHTWLRFYVRRFFRIAPLYYMLLLPSFAGLHYFRTIMQANLSHKSSIVYDPTVVSATGINMAMHFSFLFGLFPQYCAASSLPDWSIGLEMQFYAVFPFLMLAVRKINVAKFSLLLVALWIACRHLVAVYVTSSPLRLGLFPQPSFFLLKAGVFLVGMLLAWAYMEQRSFTSRAALLVLISVGIAGLCNPVIVVTALTIAFLLFYDEDSAGLGIRPLVTLARTILSNRVSRFLGDVSYGVYLLHMLVLFPVLSILNYRQLYIHQCAAVRFAILAGIIVAVTYPTAWLLSRFVEAPCVQLGKYLADRIGLPRTRIEASSYAEL